MRFIWILLALPAAGQTNDAMRAAMAQQQAAARIQAQAAGAKLIPWGPGPAPAASVEADCDPIDAAVMNPMIEAASKASGVQVKLLRAVIERESGYRACAVSAKGAMGLMQLMPATAEQFGVTDAFDAKESIDAGSKLLKQLIDKYPGNLRLALAAYNAGTAAVEAAKGVPDIAETRDYVSAILEKIAPTRTDPPSTPKPKPTGN